jgi:two-component system CheB/CheR fusion protein
VIIKKTPLTLEAIHLKYTALFETMKEGLLIADDEGRYIDANPAACTLFGMRREKIIGLHVEDFSDSRRKADVRKAWRAFLKEGTQRGRFHIYRPDGTTRYVDYTARAQVLPNCHLSVLQDITENEQVEQSLKEKEDKLRTALTAAQAATQAKTQFTANISHEIRTPLNGIIGSIELLRDTPLSAEQLEYANMLEHSSHSLMALVNDLLDFSRIELGQLKLLPSRFNIFNLVKTVLFSFAHRARLKKLAMTCKIQRDIPPQLEGDCGRLRQVVGHLIGNAVKFTSHGKIFVTVSKEIENALTVVLRFSIHDTGQGIPLKQQRLLFRPFTQADNTPARSHSGTGLGLAMSKQIVELMSGKIGFTSSPGKGSTVWFTLPFHKYAVHSNQTSRSPTPKQRLSARGRILIAEDNRINQVVALRQLQKLGYTQITTAQDGREVLKALKKSNYDLILMDCQMPRLDGYQTTQSIRRKEKTNHIPIIAMTAHAMEEDRQKCLAAGMNDYVSKPVQLQVLQKLLDRWLNHAPRMKENKPIMVLSEPVDLKRLQEVVPIDEKGYAPLISTYFSDTRSKLSQLERLIRQRAPKKIKEVAHSALGASRMLGITSVAGRLQELEEMGTRGDLARAAITLKRTREELQRTKKYLQDVLL